jgi:hypothetical protein
VFEASHTGEATAPPEAIWALWEDPSRWPDWNEQLESAELDGELSVGAGATIKFKRGGKMRFSVVDLEDGRVLTDEAKLPGCRFGHEHRVDPLPGGARITHRLYLKGPTSTPFSFMFGRKRLRESVARFVEREIELTS